MFAQTRTSWRRWKRRAQTTLQAEVLAKATRVREDAGHQSKSLSRRLQLRDRESQHEHDLSGHHISDRICLRCPSNLDLGAPSPRRGYPSEQALQLSRITTEELAQKDTLFL